LQLAVILHPCAIAFAASSRRDWTILYFEAKSRFTSLNHNHSVGNIADTEGDDLAVDEHQGGFAAAHP